MKLENSQDSILLSTKLKMPAPRKNYIVRHELFELLSQSNEVQITYVMGAAGTGKTTLLSSFIKQTGLKNTAWLSLDETNDNVFSFWHYFAAAVGNFLGSQREDILSLIRLSFETSHMENLITILVNQLCSHEDFYIVLDDVQYIKNRALIHTLEFFLKSMPNNFHIFMLSRENPALYLGEFAVSGQLLFISGDKLKFSWEEGTRFLKETLKLAISDDKIAQMNNFAEGWIGGLQLVAAVGNTNKGLLHSTGSTIAADYLTREIFKSLNEEERYFLTVTSILSYFDEDICKHLISELNFHNMMENLMNKNLFIICLDEVEKSYRYHNILGEYLKQRFQDLSKEEQTTIQKNAAKALAKRGENEEAFYLLLHAEEFEDVISLLKNMDETVETWNLIDQLPLHYLISDINLSIQCIMYNIGTLNINRCREICKAIEHHYKDEDIVKALPYIYLYIDDKFDSSISPVFLTLDQIDKFKLSPVAQSILLIESANILLTNRNYIACDQFINRALETCGANICLEFYILATKAQILEEVGKLNKSLEVYDEMGKLLKSTSMVEAIGYNHYIGAIGVYHKRFDEKSSMNALNAVEKILDSSNIPPVIVQQGYQYHLAEYHLLFGDAQKGAQIIEKIIDGYLNKNVIQIDRLLSVLHAKQLLKPQLIDRFILEFNKQQKPTIISQLLYARLMYEKGETGTAEDLVEEVLTFSRANKNRLRLVEADLLKIRMMILNHSNESRLINNLLREAIYYAWDNQIILPFILEKSVLHPYYIQYLRSSSKDLDQNEVKFLQDIISLCSGKEQKSEKEILSPREMEVLNELSNGLTNPEIAESLCISLSTVKTHIINIFGKLEVSTRLAAVEEAKRRKIINNPN